RGEINALQEKVAELESRLDGVIVSWTRSREDLDTAESEAHRILANRYANFVEQSLYGLARKAAKAKQIDIQGEVVVDLLRKLCDELFGRADVSEQRLRRILGVRVSDPLAEAVRRVVTQGRGIVAESRRMKDWGSWDFEHMPGAPINSARQQAWGRCDASAPVRFVVAPSYVVGSTAYCRQWVYTEFI
ncbi:hypothetical protein ACFWMG_21295, partial [Streptomyces sp. NPDC127074]|uniref:hypothetical protein n=1 Tax=Streptomyces sp. NPDC127074 TaxID=3347130 RepID=UPI00364609AA